MHQEDAAAQAECKTRAAFKREQKQLQRQSENQPTSSPAAPSDCGIGLCGLGDVHHPIAGKLFDPVADQTAFVKTMHQQWNNLHSQLIEVGSDIPEKAIKRTCGEFCTNAMIPPNSEMFPQYLSSGKNLLTNICRSMRPMYSGFQKQLTKDCRHPLLLLRAISDDGTVRQTLGWMLTLATFRPMRVDGILLTLPPVLDRLCKIELKLQHVPKSGWSTFAFVSMERMTFELAQLNQAFVDEDCSVQYFFTSSYDISWKTSMTHLCLKVDPSWSPVCLLDHDNGLDNDDDDDPDDNGVDDQDGIDADLDTIANLVDGMTQGSKQNAPAPKKRQRTAKKQQAKDGA